MIKCLPSDSATDIEYKVQCPNCHKTYVGETGRMFGAIRLHEHRTEVESKTKRAFITSQRTSSLTEHNNSALTENATQENHIINGFRRPTVIDRDPDQCTRWSTEAVHIRKRGQQAINRDVGSYQLSQHTTTFLTRHVPIVSRTGRTSTSFSWWRLLIEVKTSKSKYYLVVFY